MQTTRAAELTLIRHAPVVPDGRVYGRRDLAADCNDRAMFDALRAQVPVPGRLIHSPALRCVQTLSALWPGSAATPCPALREQDFGAGEGLCYTDLPDLGPLPRRELCDHRPPGGERLADRCARAAPALEELARAGPATIVAHAGTIRAALALALGAVSGALAFEIAPLSVTRIACLPDGNFIIREVNSCAVPTR